MKFRIAVLAACAGALVITAAVAHASGVLVNPNGTLTPMGGDNSPRMKVQDKTGSGKAKSPISDQGSGGVISKKKN